jgi:lipoprotein NlpD
MSDRGPNPLTAAVAAWLALVLSACTATNDAPIEERSQHAAAPRPAPSLPPAPAARATAAATREAHDGVYVVQAGDTLYSIALAFGQDYREIARWNGIDAAAALRVGQSLRVGPPAADDSNAAVEATAVPVAPTGTVEARPLAPKESAVRAPETPLVATERPAAPAPGSAAPTAPTATPAAPTTTAPIATAPTTMPPTAAAEPEHAWTWPGAGKLLERFDETHNKGIDIGGNIGDPVWAANDGQVVYSGSGLPNYGKLVIIKHTDDYVSVYAHNNEILVTQGQAVKRGQRIADLGMTDAATPRLHFEIRRRGTPVDPLMYLPSR